MSIDRCSYQCSQGSLDLLLSEGHDLEPSSSVDELVRDIRQNDGISVEVAQELFSQALSKTHNIDQVGEQKRPRHKVRASMRGPHEYNAPSRPQNTPVEFLSFVCQDKGLHLHISAYVTPKSWTAQPS
jgi:hypothetical protein